MLLMTEVE